MNIPLGQALRRAASFRAREALGLQIKPFKLRIAVTNRCNARCRMCNAWKAPDAPREELTLAEFERLFAANRRFLSALRHVSLTGGEPTLRADLADLLRLVHRHHPRASINVNSNGFLTDRLLATATALAEEGVLVAYNLSLDGMGATHDEMRGVPGASERVLRSLEALRALKESGGRPLRIGVNHVITQTNYAECAPVYAFCQERHFSFNPILPVYGELYDNETMRFDMTPEARETVIGVLAGMLRRDPGKALALSEIIRQLQGGPRDFRCWAGHLLLLVEEDGEVFPNGGCPREWALGSLRRSDFDLAALLAAPQARQVLDRVKKCRACELACETLTTLHYPEALAARRKLRRLAQEDLPSCR